MFVGQDGPPLILWRQTDVCSGYGYQPVGFGQASPSVRQDVQVQFLRFNDWLQVVRRVAVQPQVMQDPSAAGRQRNRVDMQQDILLLELIRYVPGQRGRDADGQQVKQGQKDNQAGGESGQSQDVQDMPVSCFTAVRFL